MPIPLPILPQLPGPFQIVRSVNYPSIPIAGQLPIPQLLRLGTGRTPGRRQTLILSKAEVSPSNLLGSSLTGLPRGAQSLFNCPRVCYEVHQSGSRTGPPGVAPSFPSRGECIPMLKWGDTAPETLQQLKFCSHPWDHKTVSCFQGGNRIPESTHELLSCYSTFYVLKQLFPPFLPPLAGSFAPYPLLASVPTSVVLAPHVLRCGFGGLFLRRDFPPLEWEG